MNLNSTALREPASGQRRGWTVHEPSERLSALLIMNLEGSIVHVNDVALQMLRCKRDLVIGRHYGRYLQFFQFSEKLADVPARNNALERCLTSEQSFYVLGMMRNAEGDFQPVEACLTPLYTNLAITGALVVIESFDAWDEEAVDGLSDGHKFNAMPGQPEMHSALRDG